LVRALSLSVVLQINVVTMYYALGRALEFPLAFREYFVIVPLALFVMLVPVSINAIGVREGIFVLLLAAFGIGAAEAIALAWLEYGIVLLYGIFGGVVYAVRKSPVRSLDVILTGSEASSA
jgi:hypothetical protein